DVDAQRFGRSGAALRREPGIELLSGEDQAVVIGRVPVLLAVPDHDPAVLAGHLDTRLRILPTAGGLAEPAPLDGRNRWVVHSSSLTGSGIQQFTDRPHPHGFVPTAAYRQGRPGSCGSAGWPARQSAAYDTPGSTISSPSNSPVNSARPRKCTGFAVL